MALIIFLTPPAPSRLMLQNDSNYKMQIAGGACRQARPTKTKRDARYAIFHLSPTPRLPAAVE